MDLSKKSNDLGLKSKKNNSTEPTELSVKLAQAVWSSDKYTSPDEKKSTVEEQKDGKMKNDCAKKSLTADAVDLTDLAVLFDVPNDETVKSETVINKVPSKTDLDENVQTDVTENPPQITTKAPPTVRDGRYFLNLLTSEQVRLVAFVSDAENYLLDLEGNTEVTDEIFGLLRVAAGKARLLISKKMKQFEGLCLCNLNPSVDDSFVISGEDLEGYWDVILLQVHDVNLLFEEIELYKKNDWKKIQPEKIKNVANKELRHKLRLEKHSTVQDREKMAAELAKRKDQLKALRAFKQRSKRALENKLYTETTPNTTGE